MTDVPQQQIEALSKASLFAVERLNAHFDQHALVNRDASGRIYFFWTFEWKDEPVQVHLIQTVQSEVGSGNHWALAVADFGQDGAYAREWSKKHKVIFRKAKTCLLQTEGINCIYSEMDSYAGE